jgi:3-methyladenine DNA glycosylase AlkD
MEDIIKSIRSELVSQSDEKTRETAARFFREEIVTHGVGSAAVKKISKSHFRRIRELEKKDIFRLCDELWKSGYLEEASIASEWAYGLRDRFEEADFRVFDRWVNKHVSNWASCDTLCNHAVGAFVEQFPEYISELKKWALSKNRWARRASAVTLIIPARHGKFIDEVFEIADILLMDDDDLVLKGYGWMLKAASEAHQEKVFDYVVRNRERMPRTALRYAIEKMPQEMKKKAMAR